MYKETIGVVGGFGAYATLNFYKRFLDVFATGKERNYPHIIMDNDFTMPSRTRALLYGEAYDEIVGQIAESVRYLMEHNARRIVLVCGTAHYFLKDVYKRIPEAEGRVLDLINLTAKRIQEDKSDQVLVIAAEGALEKNLYPDRMNKYGIKCICPGTEDYGEIRYFIECVKKNMMDVNTQERFLVFLEKFGVNNVILGCTEFPVLVHSASRNKLLEYKFYDPLEIVLDELARCLE